MTLEDRARLRRIELVLAALVLLVALAGRRYATFPLVAWPVFCTWDEGRPGPSFSLYEAVVIDRAGRPHVLAEGRDVFPMDRTELLRRAVHESFVAGPARDAWRRYLVHLARHALPHVDAARIEGWRTDWDVDARRVPPLTRASPRARVQLGILELTGAP